MQPKTGKVHILDGGTGIKPCQYQPQPSSMFRLNALLASRLVKFLQPLVLEVFNHGVL